MRKYRSQCCHSPACDVTHTSVHIYKLTLLASSRHCVEGREAPSFLAISENSQTFLYSVLLFLLPSRRIKKSVSQVLFGQSLWDLMYPSHCTQGFQVPWEHLSLNSVFMAPKIDHSIEQLAAEKSQMSTFKTSEVNYVFHLYLKSPSARRLSVLYKARPSGGSSQSRKVITFRLNS